MNRARLLVLAGFVAAALGFGLWTTGASATEEKARAVIRNAEGAPVGIARFAEEDGGTLVRVTVENLPHGFHGFHVHTVGKCEQPKFTSAGGHLNLGGHGHGEHAGDLPVLYVNADRTGEARYKVDGFGIADLFDADGSALIIHAKPDNYANIPTRYAPAPDAMTLATGDAGDRIACGTIE